MTPIIQIAGVIDQDEADLLIHAGVRYLGFPLRLPVNKEDLSETQAAEIIKTLPKQIKAVLITYQNNAAEIVQLCRQLRADHIQLHGEISVEELQKVKKMAPQLTLFKSLITGKYSLDQLKQTITRTESFVDAFITDSYNPSTGATGATGRTHDWSISRKLVNHSSKPVILAGGLTPRNVYEAVKTVKPAGVDAHTGVEGPDGRKALTQIEQFIRNAQAAFNEL
jgi:phosphoribosylanthranilate isomerase